MEYILISEGKLKVMLEREDLEEWDISADRLDYSDPEAKRVFGDILGYAKRELGFDTSGSKVLFQLYPSRDGSCELFITCIGRCSDKLSTDEASKHAGMQRAYSFDCLEHLLAVCKRLVGASGFRDSSAWFDEDGVWYLTFFDTEATEELDMLPLNRLSFICEYGESEAPKTLSLYLCEYGKAICQGNAIEQLGRL